MKHIVNVTPKDLKEFGIIVRFSHLRLISPPGKREKYQDGVRLIDRQGILKGRKEIDEFKIRNPDIQILSVGGKTICNLVDGDIGVIASGYCICNPICDNFNKRIGRQKAFGLAIQSLQINDPDRYAAILSKLSTVSIRPKLESTNRRYTKNQIKFAFMKFASLLPEVDSRTIEEKYHDFNVLLK